MEDDPKWRGAAAAQAVKDKKAEIELGERMARQAEETEEMLKLKAAELEWPLSSSQKLSAMVQTFNKNLNAAGSAAALPAAPALPAQLLGPATPEGVSPFAAASTPALLSAAATASAPSCPQLVKPAGNSLCLCHDSSRQNMFVD